MVAKVRKLCAFVIGAGVARISRRRATLHPAHLHAMSSAGLARLRHSRAGGRGRRCICGRVAHRRMIHGGRLYRSGLSLAGRLWLNRHGMPCLSAVSLVLAVLPGLDRRRRGRMIVCGSTL